MDELTPLGNDRLNTLRDDIRTPRYDRSALTPGIVHVGVGNFHRAHMAWYLHRLFDQGLDHDWAILGAGVREADAAQRVRLLQQDCLTTLIELDPAGKSAEVTGAMIHFLEVAGDNAPLIAAMARPEIRIVSMTVTEGGYYLDPTTGGIDTTHPDIMHDIANPAKPRTVFGAMVEALRQRRKAGNGPFTGLSCDNVQGNGNILRQVVLYLARATDPDLADWIEAQCTFPNSMVDCIVPATGPNELALAKSFGIEDAAPVTHENYRQWVLEDAFCAGRPALENVGATLSDNVHSYETMKLRILNGGHQLIAVPGDLLGIPTISGCMETPQIRAFLRKVVQDEVAPHVQPVPEFTPEAYLDLIDRRFSNPEIHDTTRRVAFDGSSRQPGFLLPSVRDGIAAKTPVAGLALASALWARYCEGTREDGSQIEPNDPDWAKLTRVAQEARSNPSAWLAQTHIYGDLGQQAEFAELFADSLIMIYDRGAIAALETYTAL